MAALVQSVTSYEGECSLKAVDLATLTCQLVGIVQGLNNTSCKDVVVPWTIGSII